jgi:hypothetical protein
MQKSFLELYETVMKTPEKVEKVISEGKASAKKAWDAAGMPADELEKMLSYDPTNQKKYADWMVKMKLANKDLDIARLEVVKDFEKAALEQKITGDDKDIQKIDSVEKMEAIVKKAKETMTGTERKTAISKARAKGQVPEKLKSMVVFEGPNSFAIKVDNKEDSIAYGSHGMNGQKGWCISYDDTKGEGSNAFDQYYFENSANVYFVFPFDTASLPDKYWAKVAVIAYPDGRLEFYDAIDKKLGDSEVNKFVDLLGDPSWR